MQWGRYRLEVSTGERDGPVTSIGFDAGWYTEATADTPDMLEVALDKPEYAPGDSMTVAVTARTAGKVTLNVIGERLLTTVTQDVKPGTARLRVPVGKDWGTGAYVVATLRRPLDASAQRMPGRAIGVQWFSVNRKARTLAVNMAVPQLARPGSALRIPVKIGGLAAGEEARIVVAAVDVGILNLTNYKPPAPDDYYLGQRRLAADLRDLYGQLIDGMQGTRGQIRSGGDIAAAELQGSPPAQKPLALYSGVVTVKPDGTAEIVFDIPDFAGTARVMAVAWSRDKVGRANADVTIRDPVVVTATLPRFLLNGDRGTMHLDIDNVEGQAGDYRVEVQERRRQRHRQCRAADGAAQRQAAQRRLGAADGAGCRHRQRHGARQRAGRLRARTQLRARGASRRRRSSRAARCRPWRAARASRCRTTCSPTSCREPAACRCRSACRPRSTRRRCWRRSTAIRSAAPSRSPAARCRCSMSTISPAPRISRSMTAVDQRIRESIDRLLSRQGSNGSFGLWSAGGDDVWLDAYVTDFLTRARERNFAVPDIALPARARAAAQFRRQRRRPRPKDGGRNLAYALYVLARNGAAPVGDLRYFVDTKLDDFATTDRQGAARRGARHARRQGRAPSASTRRRCARWRRSRRSNTAASTTARCCATAPRWSRSRRKAARRAPPSPARSSASRPRAASRPTPRRRRMRGWCWPPARWPRTRPDVALDVAGETTSGRAQPALRCRASCSSRCGSPTPARAPLQAVVTVNGAPLVPEPAAERGFKIERLYFTLDGKPADPAKARQNDRFAVVLRITEPQPQFGRVIVADYLPAGLRDRQSAAGVVGRDRHAAPGSRMAPEPVNSEFRDDRFSAAFDRKSGDPSVFTVAYVVRAVSPGRYVHPQAFVEDMYRPDRFGRTATGTVEVTAAR